MRLLIAGLVVSIMCVGAEASAQATMSNLSYPRFALVRIYITDLAKADRFYRNVFEMNDGRGSNAHEKVLAFADPATPVLVLSNATPPAIGDMTSFALIVPNLDTVLSRTPSFGGSIEQPARDLGAYGRIAFVKDPTGNRIEVLEPAKAADPQVRAH